MKNIFIVPGYGIPKDILKDEQYRRYIGLVFNHIYQISLDNDDRNPVVIFTGGKTDVFKPYKRTEAVEMKKLFLFYAKREFSRKITSGWKYLVENKSLVSNENIYFSYDLSKKTQGSKRYYIFCETTRWKKMKRFSKEVIKKNYTVIPIDFDLSVNRYRDPEFLRRKEEFSIKYELKAVKDKEFGKKFHKLLKERLVYFRQEGTGRHKEAINDWWKEQLNNLNKGA